MSYQEEEFTGKGRWEWNQNPSFYLVLELSLPSGDSDGEGVELYLAESSRALAWGELVVRRRFLCPWCGGHLLILYTLEWLP